MSNVGFLQMILFIAVFVSLGTFSIANAEDLTIPIPAGDHERGLRTVIEWYTPINHDVEIGDTVTWINNDEVSHTVTSGKGIGPLGNPDTDKAQPDGYFDSGIISPEKTWSFTFKEEGFFSYTCTIHPWIERSITVLEPGIDISKEIRISYALITTIAIIVAIIVGAIITIILRRRQKEKAL